MLHVNARQAAGQKIVEDRKHPGFGDTYFIDEVFVKVGGKQHYLWRAVVSTSEF